MAIAWLFEEYFAGLSSSSDSGAADANFLSSDAVADIKEEQEASTYDVKEEEEQDDEEIQQTEQLPLVTTACECSEQSGSAQEESRWATANTSPHASDWHENSTPMEEDEQEEQKTKAVEKESEREIELSEDGSEHNVAPNGDAHSTNDIHGEQEEMTAPTVFPGNARYQYFLHLLLSRLSKMIDTTDE